MSCMGLCISWLKQTHKHYERVTKFRKTRHELLALSVNLCLHFRTSHLLISNQQHYWLYDNTH
jgi:hypothetical protein